MKRKLGIPRNWMYAVRGKKGDVTRSMDKIVEVAQQFYRRLYSSLDSRDDNGGGSSPEEFEIPPVTAEEVKKLWKQCKEGKQLMRIR